MRAADTIFALASAPGRAGIAVLRLSGPGAANTLHSLTGRIPPPRVAQRVRFRDPVDGEAIDDGLALFFPAPRSFTGEEVVELHLHGSRAVVAAMVDALSRLPGLRPAEPGEFTRRAFQNGKLDLTEVEGLADLVAAETSAQRRQALRQLGGELGRLYEGWRVRLLRALAHVEAEIDFPEEGLPSEIWTAVRDEAQALRSDIAAHLADDHRGERLREGLSVAIIGPPNAGKSSLMNALARRDVAITAATAGTTRDVIEVALDLEGYPVVLADTAGLREASDAVEEEGVRRARARAAAADFRIVVVDATRPDEASALGSLAGDSALVVANKIDLRPGDGARWADALGAGPALRLSLRTGQGLTEMLARLAAEMKTRLAPGDAPVITRARHRAALADAAAALDRFAVATMPELAAEDLRAATRALGRITGRVDVEDMLDIIFREFCIGK
ncbi:MAG TPA: tRNA uridine-5-carboxymethylaminomethyl(34) synthesis GTPase MnmE [Stellaceae bacterium]|nr:tRNA uridine-5-carboxymethylaminomethyl(34) synthesis GTPase MnmE [Stellaceae bacterium]